MTVDMDAPTVLLRDDDGRSLLCYLEHSVDVEGKTYALLQPVDAPIIFFAWNGESEDEEPVPIEDEETIQSLFPTAKAVLGEQNLTLLPTAVTLTVEGELPDFEEDEDEDEDSYGVSDDELDQVEEFQLLATFFHDDQEYSAYTPLEPFLIITRMEGDEPKLLSADELEAIGPLLEEQLAIALEADLD